MNLRAQKVLIRDYPELNILCWDITSESIDRRSAFLKYVDRWMHVHQDKLLGAEKQLITSLTKEFGRGYFFSRTHGRARISEEFKELAISVKDIDDRLLGEFESLEHDVAYPGMRNGVQYYWRSDYKIFLDTKNNNT